MIPLGISSSKHLVALNTGFRGLLGLVIKRLKENLRAMHWVLITQWVTSQLGTWSPDTPAGTNWKTIPWAFGLCTYLVIHNQVKPPSFREPRNLSWHFDDCSIVWLAETGVTSWLCQQMAE